MNAIQVIVIIEEGPQGPALAFKGEKLVGNEKAPASLEEIFAVLTEAQKHVFMLYGNPEQAEAAFSAEKKGPRILKVSGGQI